MAPNVRAKAKSSVKKLQRSATNRMLTGVAGGIAEYYDIDPTIVRALFLILAIFSGVGLVAYIVFWILLPSAKRENNFIRFLVVVSLLIILLMMVA